ncbi:MAG: nicotinate-nucleotide adenylyltransferase [Solirubrobacteraceae bacterium]|nr:nicotinate-nucleotide adenylyltransferase [Solirubrobacteraceae bacterium]
MTSVGLLGGTFNPPHLGHLVCAMEARDQLGLDRVYLVPAGVPPHKAIGDDPGTAVRVSLCELAVKSEPGLDLLRDETRRAGPSYTVDTLRALHEASPGDELTFIVGGDQALGLPDWREPETVLSFARVAVAQRGDTSREAVLERCAGLTGASQRLIFFDMPRLDISSSGLRARVASGRPIRHLVPAAVAERIAELDLYRAGATV